MKYTKIFALFLGALSLTACSDKEEFNTASGVTVEMANSELTVNENGGLITVPVKLSGEANGPVKVQLKVEGCGEIPAVPYVETNGTWDGNYIVTSETLSIPEGETSVSVEIRLIDDILETGDRTFSVTIVSCEGAVIGNNASTLVTVADNESLPIYQLIQGDWKMSYIDRDGNKTSANFTITGYDEGTEEFNAGMLEFGGIAADLFGTTEIWVPMYLIEDDPDSDKPYVVVPTPKPFAYYDDANYVWLCGSTAPITGYLDLANDCMLIGEFDKETQSITFQQNAKMWYVVASFNFSSVLGDVGTLQNMVMTR